MLYDILKKRRSIRKYTDQPVEKEKLDRLVASALLAPSSRGVRPWRFIVVDDPEMMKKLAKCKPHGAGFLNGAPVGIVVVGDPSESDVWVEDCAIASTILWLAAEDLGLGACWCQIRKRMHADTASASDVVRALLGIPEGFEVEAIMGLGYPVEQKAGYTEDQLHYEKAHKGTWGTPYPRP